MRRFLLLLLLFSSILDISCLLAASSRLSSSFQLNAVFPRLDLVRLTHAYRWPGCLTDRDTLSTSIGHQVPRSYPRLLSNILPYSLDSSVILPPLSRRCMSSTSSPLMLSTVPPPRPVSVNSLARGPLSSSISYQKSSGRSTSAEIQIHDDSAAPTSAPALPDCQSPVDTEMNDAHNNTINVNEPEPRSYRSEACFENLPIEIHEAILDCLFGERAPASATVTHVKSAARSWTRALRHPRRKALSDLSLISQVWRPLVQSRIYRHSELRPSHVPWCWYLWLTSLFALSQGEGYHQRTGRKCILVCG